MTDVDVPLKLKMDSEQNEANDLTYLVNTQNLAVKSFESKFLFL